MKILVTGASGFIGRYLASYAAERGHEVVGTYLSEPELASRIPTDRRVRWRRLDLQDGALVAATVEEERPEAVFHLGAQAYAQRAWADPIDTFRTNVLGTIALYEALRARPPAHGVLLAASAAGYGIPPSLPIAEEAPLWATNPYGVSKTCQEAVSYQYAKNFGLRILRARLFGTTGPGKSGDALNDFARQVARLEREGQPATLRVGNLDTRRDIQDIRDAVPALWTVFESGTPEQPINVGAGTSYSIRAIVDQLVRLAQVPLTVDVDPALLRPTDELDNVADVRRLRGLGHVPRIPFSRTVADALEFWRQETPGPAASGA
ncbi:MAG TPA: GDP-mannose 4,6-dehydratase [Thermoplasmata archaeon]|nr:GDP-mannose 4,6-dehydratase [Thermoplasmata archaeon]